MRLRRRWGSLRRRRRGRGAWVDFYCGGNGNVFGWEELREMERENGKRWRGRKMNQLET